MKNKLNVVYAGLMEYGKALELQNDYLNKRAEKKINDTLIILQHYPVLTRGRRASDSEILVSSDILQSSGISLFDVDRGGKTTYHGPGQIVGYLISDFNESHEGNIGNLVTKIENVFINMLKKEYNIISKSDPDNRGVWIENKKITAIGISIKRGITMHGFAFNVNPDMEHFAMIVPCGIQDRGVISLSEKLNKELNLENITDVMLKYFIDTMNYEIAEEKRINE